MRHLQETTCETEALDGIQDRQLEAAMQFSEDRECLREIDAKQMATREQLDPSGRRQCAAAVMSPFVFRRIL